MHSVRHWPLLCACCRTLQCVLQCVSMSVCVDEHPTIVQSVKQLGPQLCFLTFTIWLLQQQRFHSHFFYLRKRILHLYKKALSLCKRALYLRKRGLYLLKRVVCLYTRDTSPYTRALSLSLHKGPISPQRSLISLKEFFRVHTSAIKGPGLAG